MAEPTVGPGGGGGSAEVAERDVEVVNAEGMHARPSHLFVVTANRFGCEVELGLGDRKVNGKSIMMIMTLAAECGSRLRIRAKGPGASEAVESLVKLVSSGFKA
ncbi:MAG: HPr family phosphocarrier protein [Planctomycetes bacterium]|nr:HPr family phosphocarrier protein [Planctomycetota bacterium]